MTTKIIISIASKLFLALYPLLSGEIQRIIKESLLELHKRAKETDNIFDDLFTSFLLQLTGVISDE